MVTDADEVSHINGWVSLVSDINSLAYLIDLPEKMQAKMGKGKEKRQFLTEKASDRQASDFSDTAWLIINTTYRGGFQ